MLTTEKARLQDAFLAAYATCGSVTGAARAAGCSRTAHYQWLQDDPTYPARYQQAHEESCESLEIEARRRAVDGVLEPQFYKGEMCAASDGSPIGIQKYSDTLLIFLMKGSMPEKYREQWKGELSGSVSLPTKLDLSKLNDDELRQLHEFFAKASQSSADPS